MATCEFCSKPITDNALTCPSCQATLRRACPQCGKILAVYTLKCDSCGEVLPDPVVLPPLPPIVHRPPANFGSTVLRVAAVLFVIVGLIAVVVSREKPAYRVLNLVAMLVMATSMVTLANVWDHSRATWNKVSQIERELTRRR